MTDHTETAPGELQRVEEISRIPAKIMLLQSGLLSPASADAVVLDNACGLGVVAGVLFDAVGNNGVKIVCGDVKPKMVEWAAERFLANKWNAEAKIIDAQAISYPDNYFTHTTMNFGLQVLPDSQLGLKESFRVLQPGGTFAFTTWINPGWLDTFNAAVPGFQMPPIFTNKTWSTKEGITTVLTTAGFTNIQIEPCTFDHTTSTPVFVHDLRWALSALLAGEAGDMYEAYMKKTYGDGECTFTWEALVVTASKP